MELTVADENEWPHLCVSISPSIIVDWRWGGSCLLFAVMAVDGTRVGSRT